MDEAGARALLERLSATRQPPSRVDIGLARQRGSTLLRRRRWALAGASLLAAAVVALVIGIGALTGANGGPRIPPPATSHPARYRFDPLAPYAAFGWLPKGDPRHVSSPGSAPTELQLMAGSAANGQFLLSVWAPATCNRDAAQVRADLRGHHHPLLTCTRDEASGWTEPVSGPAPAVAGRPAFWIAGHVLAWEYAPHAWATLRVFRLGAPIPAAATIKVAAHVRFAATAKPVLKFPFQLTGLPVSWRVLSVDGWRATADGLLAGASSEFGYSTAVGPAGGPARGTIGFIVVTPGKAHCHFFRGLSKRVDLGGVTAVVTRFADTGAAPPPNQGLCVQETNGLHVSFVEFAGPGHAGYAFGGVTGVFKHHLRLLGPDPANWTTRPLG